MENLLNLDTKTVLMVIIGLVVFVVIFGKLKTMLAKLITLAMILVQVSWLLLSLGLDLKSVILVSAITTLLMFTKKGRKYIKKGLRLSKKVKKVKRFV